MDISLFLLSPTLYTRRLKRLIKTYLLTSSSAGHRHGDVISRFIPAAVIGPTTIREAKSNRADDDCCRRPDEYVYLGLRSALRVSALWVDRSIIICLFFYVLPSSCDLSASNSVV